MRLYANLGLPRGQLAWIAADLGGEVVERFADSPDGPAVLRVGEERLLGRDLLKRLGIEIDEVSAASMAEVAALLEIIEGAESPTDEEDYAAKFHAVFEMLDQLEQRLDRQRFIGGGERPTIADWFLWCVLLRFDAVYYPLYKLNRTRVVDMPNLSGFLRDLWQQGVGVSSLDWAAIKAEHFLRDVPINHRRIVPRGGVPDLALGHDRDRFADDDDAKAVEESPGAPVLPGAFVRKQSGHRDWITADGASGFPAEAGRYHLYVANNCPWCHRVALTRSLLHLDEAVTMDVLFYRRDPDRGWQFAPNEPGCTPDTVFGHRYIQQLYERVGSRETSVPVLYDRETDRIVSNESAEIIRMLDQAFGDRRTSALYPEGLYPAKHRASIDELNAWIYTDVNNGAYKAGFAKSQAAYDAASAAFFAALARLDRRFEGRRFLCGDVLTEADVRLFPTVFRFDHVYFTRFRLNDRMVRDLEHLHRWLREMNDVEEVRAASNLEHCKKGYFGRTGNGIVPLGPDFGFEAP